MAGVGGVKVLLLWMAFVYVTNCQSDTADAQSNPSVTASSLNSTGTPVRLSDGNVSNVALAPGTGNTTTTKPDVLNEQCSFTVIPVPYGFHIDINGTNQSNYSITSSADPEKVYDQKGTGRKTIGSLKPCTEYELNVFDSDSNHSCQFTGGTKKTEGIDANQIEFNEGDCRKGLPCYTTQWNITEKRRATSDICTNLTTTFPSIDCKSNFTLTNNIPVDVEPPTKFPVKSMLPKNCKQFYTDEYICESNKSTTGRKKNLSVEQLEPFTAYNCTVFLNSTEGKSSLPVPEFRIDCDLKLSVTKKICNTFVNLQWEITSVKCPTNHIWTKLSYRCNCTDSQNKSTVVDTKDRKCVIAGLTPITNYTCEVQPLYDNETIPSLTERLPSITTQDLKWRVHVDNVQNTSVDFTLQTESFECQTELNNLTKLSISCKLTPKASIVHAINKKFVLHGLNPFTKYTCEVQPFYDNKMFPSLKARPLTFKTSEGVPETVTEVDVTFVKHNEIQVRCNGPTKLLGEEKNQEFFATLGDGWPEKGKKLCNFIFKDLDYLTKYEIKLYTSNGKNTGPLLTYPVTTLYNDKAVIGFLVFLIILILAALLFVSYKIYGVKHAKSRDLSEKIGLIPSSDNEENLRLIEPIPATMLEDTYKQKAADEARLFLAEFQSIPRIFSRYTVKEARKNVNVPKNRYTDILPYDYNRVQLTTGNGETGCDFINASFINGFKEPKKYIAAQGPKEETLGDFWRMIWEQKSSIIVMVTRCKEGKKPKCEQYWPSPDQDTEMYEEFKVTLQSEDVCPDYIIRHLTLKNKNESGPERKVTQIQFISWPDHGVPNEAQLLLKLRRRVNAFNNLFSGPIIVHCSAGVGRTGTYISIDAMMESLDAKGEVDVFGYVVSLRQQRGLMVQVEGQYILIHRALLEYNRFGETEISLADLHSTVATLKRSSNSEPTLMDEEFERVASNKNCWTANIGMMEENRKKNRFMTVIPYDFNRVLVKPNEDGIINKEYDDEDDEDSSIEDDSGEEFARYINASYINGYWGARSFITTQTPLPETIADFWLMVYQNNTSMIVMFSDSSEDDKESDLVYWDTDNKAYGDIEVEMMNEKTYPTFISRNTLIRHIKNKETRPVKHIQFLNWKSGELPESPQVMMDFIKEVRGSSGASKSKLSSAPIVVHCSNGSSCCGIFCALWNLLDSAETEKLVDVFQVSKSLCKERKGLISSLNQYRFLYEALQTLYPVQNGDVKAESDLVEIVDETKAAERPPSGESEEEKMQEVEQQVKLEVKEESEEVSSSPTDTSPVEEDLVTVEV